MSQTTRIEVEDDFSANDIGGRLLPSIAKGLYTHDAVLREYVQNARDAYMLLDEADRPEEMRIILTPEGEDLHILDYGVGMDLEALRGVKRIAVSGKFGRGALAGFRGIGVWAGLYACERLEVRSTATGETSQYSLVIDFSSIVEGLKRDPNINLRDLLQPNYRIYVSEDSEPSESHYTLVTLHRLRAPRYTQLSDPEELIRIASIVCPCRLDPAFKHVQQVRHILDDIPDYHEFRILIQTEDELREAFRSFFDESYPPEKEVLRGPKGRDLAIAWWCPTTANAFKPDPRKLKQRGIQLRVMNIAVGSTDTYSAQDGSKWGLPEETRSFANPQRMLYFCGEIHVVDPEIRPNTQRNDLEPEDNGTELVHRIRSMFAERKEEADALAQCTKADRQLRDANLILRKYRQRTVRAGSADESALEKLIDGLRKTLDDTSGSVGRSKKKKYLVKLLKPTAGDRESTVRKLESLKAAIKRKGEGAPPGAPSSRAGTVSVESQGSEGATGESGGNGSATIVSDVTLPPGRGDSVEALISDLIAVLEERLGPAYPDLPELERQIEEVVRNWDSY